MLLLTTEARSYWLSRRHNSEVEPCEKISDEKIEEIVGSIEAKNRKRMLVEDIQDIIEQGLMADGKFVLAKTYIIYRYSRELIRKAKLRLMILSSVLPEQE